MPDEEKTTSRFKNTSDNNTALANRPKRNAIPFKKLTPEAADLSPYREAFEFVYSNDDIRNIAISGPFGSGKSSLMKALREDDKISKGTFLTISLAHFTDDNDEIHNLDKTDSDGNGDNLGKTTSGIERDRILEGRVLNQLVHRIDQRRVPKTRFKRTLATKSWKNVAMAFFALIGVLAVCLAFDIGGIRSLFPPECDVPLRVLSWVCILLLVFFGAYSAAKKQNLRYLLRKISVQGTEVELFDNRNDSRFDKYLDDIVYMLKSNSDENVIFEDLDRFDSVNIFERLRSINELVNYDNGDNRQQPVRFFYLIRDDIFKRNERTKFFDFIIPIIPYIDFSNSGDVLYKLLEGVDAGLDSSFVYEISLFVGDARLAHNIFNEYMQYCMSLYGGLGKTPKADAEKLFSLVAYKNVFPEDFAGLQLGRGYAYDCLNKREWLIAKLADEFNAKIAQTKDEMQKERERLAISETDLKMLYGCGDYYRAIQTGGNYGITNGVNDGSIHDAATILSMLEEKKSNDAELTKIEETLNDNPEYRERLDALTGDAKKENAVREEAIQRLNNRITELSRMGLSELMELADDDVRSEFFSAKNPSNNGKPGFSGERTIAKADVQDSQYDLVKYLVINGYIDASYHHFMSYFHAGALTPDDRQFMKEVALSHVGDSSRALDVPSVVVERMQPSRFGQAAARNYYLLRALLESGREDAKCQFFKSLAIDSDETFLLGYVCSEEYNPKLFVQIAKYGEQLLANSIEDTTKSVQERRILVWHLLIDGNELLDMDSVIKPINDFVHEDSLFLSAEPHMAASLLKAPLNKVDIKLGNIDFDASDPDLLAWVYKHGAYDPTLAIVKGMLATQCSCKKEDLELNNLFTTLSKFTGSPIYEYSQLHVVEILDQCIGIEGYKSIDNENGILFILNNESVDSERKCNYIALVQKKILILIERVTDTETWESLLDERIIVPTSHNVLRYYLHCGEKIDATLAGYFNDQPISDLSSGSLEAEKVNKSLFAKNLINTALVSEETLGNLAISIGAQYELAECDKVEVERIRALIRKHAVQMNTENLNVVRKSYQEAVQMFIELNVDAYIALLKCGEELFRLDEAEEVFKNSKVPDVKKLGILRQYEGTVSLSSDYPNSLNAEIVSGHFSSDNVAQMVGMAKDATGELADAINKKLIELAVEQANLGENVPYSSLLLISNDPNVNSGYKKKLLANNVSHLSRGDTVNVLKAAGFVEYAIVVDGIVNQKKIVIDGFDRALIDALRQEGYVGREISKGNSSIMLYRNKRKD